MPRPAGCSKIIKKIQEGRRKTKGICGIFHGLQIMYVIFSTVKIGDISPLKKALCVTVLPTHEDHLFSYHHRAFQPKAANDATHPLTAASIKGSGFRHPGYRSLWHHTHTHTHTLTHSLTHSLLTAHWLTAASRLTTDLLQARPELKQYLETEPMLTGNDGCSMQSRPAATHLDSDISFVE